MRSLTDILMVALIVIYIVDVSGFTDSWRNALKEVLQVGRLKPLPPFDCSRCMVWWSCLIYSAIVGTISIPVIAYCALLSLLSNPLGQIMIFIREALSGLIDKLFDKI